MKFYIWLFPLKAGVEFGNPHNDRHTTRDFESAMSANSATPHADKTYLHTSS